MSDSKDSKDTKDTKEKPIAAVLTKRRPGRPRKKPVKEPPKKRGILDKPSSPDNLVELTYEKPANIKKLCSYWKSLSAEKIIFSFTPERLTLYTSNYKETNDVKVTCEGKRMDSYYCPAQGFEIKILFANLELFMQKLDKSYEKISFIITNKNQGKFLNIILNNDIQIPEYFEVDIIMDAVPRKKYETIFDEKVAYPLEFKLQGKHFKKLISDTKNFENYWTIEQYGPTANLIFAYKSSNGQVRAKVVPKSLKDISLKSTIKEGEIFSVSVFVNNIKPTSSNQLADNVWIKAATDRPLWIWAELDRDEGADGPSILVDASIAIVDYTKLES